MNICVLSGSPKGKYSVTYQTVRFLEKMYPEDKFNVLHIGQKIRSMEKDLTPAIEAINAADMILFCYPVYTFIAPYQLHRFIELLKASGTDVSGKFAAQICTSKHFYDVTAVNYVKDNCLDMGLLYLGNLSADMDDLLTEQGQKDAKAFWDLMKFRAENKLWEERKPEEPVSEEKYEATGIVTEKTPGNEVVIVADLKDGDENLNAMIEDFRNVYPHNSRVVNIDKFPFAGGCIECFNCAASGKCIYKDGFDDFLRNEIQTADAIIYAFRIKDHSMGTRMKLYDDRQFCNGHRTVTAGMPVGYIICGDLEKEENLRMIINGRSEVGGNFLIGTATDAEGIKKLSTTLNYALNEKLTQPANFLGVGGMKIFRDLIWVMQGMMKADHKFYKSHGLYDFPQKQKGRMIFMKFAGSMVNNPKIKAKMGNMMNEGVLMPYNKMFEKLDKKK